MKRIYMDHSATTPVAAQVLQAMLPYLSDKFGNASSLHSFGLEAKEALEESREKVAKLLGARPEEIIFTSGGTESDNLALKGIARRNKDKGKHIITTCVEHPAILETCSKLEKEGFAVTYLPVTSEGLVDLAALEAAIRPDTILISVMHANNEIGTIQPLEEIGKLAAEKDIYLHTDAVQSVGKIPTDVNALGVDLLSLSAHKLYGPKGVGALYIRRGTKLESIVQGGGHERGLRSGTENVAGIVGLAKGSRAVRREHGRRGAEADKAARIRLAKPGPGKGQGCLDQWNHEEKTSRKPEFRLFLCGRRIAAAFPRLQRHSRVHGIGLLLSQAGAQPRAALFGPAAGRVPRLSENHHGPVEHNGRGGLCGRVHSRSGGEVQRHICSGKSVI